MNRRRRTISPERQNSCTFGLALRGVGIVGAEILGVTRSQLYTRLKRFGL